MKKKYIIAGLIGLVTITGAFTYLQYKKLMDYTIGPKGVKIKKISGNLIDFDLFLNFLNKSKLQFTIIKQKYDVYMNNIFIVTLNNDSPNVIQADTTSVLGLNIKFDPKQALAKLKKNPTALLTEPSKIIVKVDTKMYIKYGIFTIPISYVYEDTLKNMTAST